MYANTIEGAATRVVRPASDGYAAGAVFGADLSFSLFRDPMAFFLTTLSR
jgi:hypothetical protein